jgi:hypothetical protein
MAGKNTMNKDHGLVYRSFIYLFDQLERRKEDATFVIKASYLEIYNEKVKPTTATCITWTGAIKAFMVITVYNVESIHAMTSIILIFPTR